MTLKIKRKKSEQNAADQALLFHAMYVMAVVDGKLAQPEAAVLRSLVATLPDFRTANLEALLTASEALSKEYGGVLESIEAFTRFSEAPDLRYRAFLLATEVAFASDGINAAEEQLLSSLSNILGLDRKLSEAIIDVLSFKYQ